MNQYITGAMIKRLREERKISQNKLAEALGVSDKAVSRWETGANMPEIEIMIELADFYEVDLKDLLRGERKEDDMDQNVKETAIAVAEYSNEDKKRMTRNFNLIFIAATVCFIGYLATLFLAPDGYSTPVFDFAQGAFLGISLGALILGILFTSGVMDKFAAAKKAWLKK